MINILVVTSDMPFGDLFRQNLEEMGRFHVQVAGDKETAVACVKEGECALAFLDTCMAEKDLLEIAIQVRHANPRMSFVVISEAGWHSALEELSPEDILSKPYNLPDLSGMMNHFFPNSQSSDRTLESNETTSDPPWLSDVTRAAQHLTRLTLESSAQAALITRFDELWAYAGQLPQDTTSELAETVSRYWDRQKENDLVRFIRLASTGAEHMLYATRLTKNMVLALIFDAETPFGTIHTQANQLVRSLSTRPSEKQDGIIETDVDGKAAKRNNSRGFNQSIPSSPESAFHFSRESFPKIPIDPLTSTDEANFSVDMEDSVETPPIAPKNKFRWSIAVQDEPVETRPGPIRESARKIVLEPASPSVYNLDYACLLIPRFANHHLIGDMSDHLAAWVQETCIAYDWRLEYISVRPEYLLWIVSVPPAASPAYLMRIMRQRTSVKIFDDFPRFKKENPSGDFWASAYLIMGRSQPPPAQVIKEFIAQTRQRQGILPQFR